MIKQVQVRAVTKKDQITRWVTGNPPQEGSVGYYNNVAKRFETSGEYVRNIVKKIKTVPNVRNNIQAKRTDTIIAEGIKDLVLPEGRGLDKKTYNIKGNNRIAVLADIHFPYHDKGALDTCLNYLDYVQPNVIVLNGDIVDFYSVSRFSKVPDAPLLKEEIEMLKMFLEHLRNRYKAADIVFKVGNHENRLYRYIADRAVGLFGLEELSLPNLFNLKEYNIDFVDDMDSIQAGNLTIFHGHEFNIPSNNTVTVSRSMLMRYLDNILFGHFHKSQEYMQTIGQKKNIQSVSVGCLCNLSPYYSPYNLWNHGFALIDLESNGTFTVENHKIINNKVY